MAVHQCTCFCSNPKALHKLAVTRIVRYLLATHDKGLLLCPTKSFALDMYIDADFAGWWHKEISHLWDSVLSCTGYVITFCGCPISWASKLQSNIAISTTESKYIALSTGTREILPVWRVLQDIIDYSFIKAPATKTDSISTSVFRSQLSPSKVYEDNTVCIVLVTTESTFKARIKHISLKLHPFHDNIRNGSLQILKVNSNSNWEDIFTKPLGKTKFAHLRQLMMEWQIVIFPPVSLLLLHLFSSLHFIIRGR